MRNTAVGLSAIAIAAFGAGSAQAGSLWIANMTSAKENPPNNAGFSGTGFVVLNDAETQASVTATHNIPANQLTGGHIHRGPAGVNGPIIFPFANPASPVGPLIWAIPAADVTNLKGGGLYMNFHTAAFPGGVIRDQFSRVLFSRAAGTTTQGAVGSALDVSAGFTAGLDQVLFGMALLPATSQAAALQDLGGDTLYSQGRQEAENMQGFQETIFQHIETSPPTAPGVSLFGTFNADWGNRGDHEGQAGSELTRQSLLGGVQYAWDVGQAGLALGYANSKDKFDNGRGETEAKTTSIQGFVATGAQIRFAAVAGYGWTDIDTDRTLPSFGLTANSSPDASVWALAGRVSAPFQVAGNLTLSPYGQLDGQWARVDSYTETGAGAVGLIVPKHNYDTSAIELGAALSTPFGGGSETVWHARLQAGWRHLLQDGEDTLPLAFIGSPVGFVQQIAGAGRDAAHLDASITGAFGPRLTASAGYRGLIGENGNVHAIELRFRYAM